jgi:NAD(P)-dependent dehydrogenase (short-subunit alcohol dehydrogenase family)
MVVVVTGVTGHGLGAALANVLANRGARVVGAGRRVQEGERWMQDVRGGGGDATFIPCDVSRVEDCRRLIESAVDRHGQIDALVNNAGVVGQPPLCESHSISEEYWDRVIDINLKGAFFCSRFALERMIPVESGVIINIASRRAVVPGPKMVAYAASKAGLVQLGVSLAEEFRGTGIRVNNVLLGGVKGESSTAMAAMVRGLDPAAVSALRGASFGGAAAAPLDASVAAEAVAVLLSPACRALTGATVAVG